MTSPLNRLFRLQIAGLVLGIIGLFGFAVLSRFSGFSSGVLYIVLCLLVTWVFFDPRWLRFILSARGSRAHSDRELLKDVFHDAGLQVPEWYWVDEFIFQSPVMDAAFGGARFRSAILVPRSNWENANLETKRDWLRAAVRQMQVGLPRLYLARIWIGLKLLAWVQFGLWISGFWFLGIPAWFMAAWFIFEKYDDYWSRVQGVVSHSRSAHVLSWSTVYLGMAIFYSRFKALPQIELTWTVYVGTPDSVATRLPEMHLADLKVLRRLGIEDRLLRKVVREGSISTVKHLFMDPRMFAYQDEWTHDNWLHVAAREGRADLIPFFLKNQVSTRAENRSSLTPVLVAAVSNQPAVLSVLRLNGVALAETNSRSQNALHLAAQAGATDVVDMLIADGWDVNIADMGGRTPLIFAVQGRQGEIARRLLQAGANPNHTDHEGSNAKDLAEANRMNFFADLVAQSKRTPSSLKNSKK